MKKSYLEFNNFLGVVNFEAISEKMIENGMQHPKVESFSNWPSSSNKKYRTSPALNGKKPYENEQNIYLRTIGILKSFAESNEISFYEYVKIQSNFDHLLNKLENLRATNEEFQILMFLIFNGSKKLIRVFLKLRKQILGRCAVDKIKFNTASLHNQSKYFKNQTYEIRRLKVDYEYWGFMVQTSKAKLPEEMLWWLSEGDRQLSAILLLKACLWDYVRKETENPQQN